MNILYVYHYLRSYLLTKKLSFRGIFSLMDSVCQNYKQNAIVFFELNKCRVHPCAQMVYVNSLDYVFFFVKSQSLSEYMYIIICVHIY